MHRHKVIAALSAFVALASPGLVLAEDAGRTEFLNSCASCHGTDAKGMGPMREALSVTPPGLTGLAKANGGEFPLGRVVQVIDGRTEVFGHGTQGMPVWGAVYSDPIQGEVDPFGATLAVRGRILSLAYFLESVQE